MIDKFFEVIKILQSNFVNSWDNWHKLCSTSMLLMGMYLIIFLFIILVLLFCFVKSKIIDWVTKHLGSISVLVCFLGTILYMIGYYRQELNALSIIPRSIISSFRMFTGTHDLARVSSILQEDAIYMTCFALLHFFAAFITFMFIFKMIGYKMKCKSNLWYQSLFWGKSVHLFWGVNDASILLAEDISKVNEKKGRKEIFIFVDVDEECENNCHKKPTLSFLTNSITIKESEISRLEKIGAYVDHCYNGPISVDIQKNDDIFGQLDLNTIKRVLKKSTSLNIYFLSNDEANNISSALILQEDKHLKDLVTKKSSPTIFVHARRDSYNEVFAHYSQYATDGEKMKIKVVDSAYLSIQSLKQDDKALPVNCVKPNPQTGTVDTPFTAMVVGFGATGQEAFKFLYEFSAFIDSNKKKTPFKCYAFDEKMNKIEGLVRAKMPAITEDELILINTSVDSVEFWGRVKLQINKLNYVVVALNNDALGMSLAVNLFKYALRYRKPSLPELKIMLRCYDRNNEKRMKRVKEKLNDSIACFVDSHPINDVPHISIQIFATSDTLFTYENVVSNLTLVKAKEFNKIYENSSLSAEDLWKKCFGNSKIDEMMKNKHMSRYHAIYEINTKISQNISNALHCKTKLFLMGITSEHLNKLYTIIKDRKPKTTKYICGQQDKTLLLNLAQIEHERWIASHKLMGFKYGVTKDYVKKQHKCMCDLGQLDEETQSYDCNVVDTTIKLAFQDAMKNKSN